MKSFSTAWNSSSNPGKQRKYVARAPLHVRHHFVAAHLSKELRGKHKRRSVSLAKGDVVRVARGQFKNRSGKIVRVDLKAVRIYIEGVDRAKKDGSKSLYPVHPSNIIVTELNLADKRREERLRAA